MRRALHCRACIRAGNHVPDEPGLMRHAAIENGTPSVCEHLFLTNEEGRSVLVVIAQAASQFSARAVSHSQKKQIPPSLAGGQLEGAAAIAIAVRPSAVHPPISVALAPDPSAVR